jgi:hypothetical protein
MPMPHSPSSTCAPNHPGHLHIEGESSTVHATLLSQPVPKEVYSSPSSVAAPLPQGRAQPPPGVAIELPHLKRSE